MRKFVGFLFLYFISAYSFGSYETYRPLVELKAIKYGVPPYALMALIRHESRGRPWTFNIDGEGMFFNSKEKAVSTFTLINQNPWMVKIKLKNNKYYRRFFNSGQSAADWSKKLANRSDTRLSIIVNPKKRIINPKRNTILIRPLKVRNVDVGLGQINYIHHGQHLSDDISFFQWLDPSTNIDYMAKHLKELMDRHDNNVVVAMAYYHNRKKKFQDRYMAKVMPIFVKEKKLYGT